MNRRLFTIGSAIFLVGSVGFMLWGRLVVDTFEVISFRISDPPPVSMARLWWLGASAIGLSVATILCSNGLTWTKTDQYLPKGRRVAIAMCSLAIVGASVIGIYVSWWALSEFANLARVAGAPEPEQFEPVMTQGASLLSTAGGLLVAAAIGLILISRFGFRRAPATGIVTSPRRGVYLRGFQFLLSLLFAFLFLNVSFSGNAVWRLLKDAESAIEPSKLASHLNSIYLQSLFGFAVLSGMGLLWAITAFAAQQPARSAEHD